jgi:L-ornithine N5-oxygenase
MSPHPSSWRFTITPLSQITSTVPSASKTRLVLKNTHTNAVSQSPQAFDVIIAAGGYTHSTPLLTDIESSGLLQGKPTVDAEYKLLLRRNAVSKDCGIWVLGSLEQGCRDEDMGYAVERGSRLMASLLDSVVDGVEVKGEVAML